MAGMDNMDDFKPMGTSSPKESASTGTAFSFDVERTFEDVEDKIFAMTLEKTEIVAQLTAEKQLLAEELFDAGGSRATLIEKVEQIDENIYCVEKQHEMKIKIIESKEFKVRGTMASIECLDKSVAELERTIARMRQEHEDAVDELTMKKKFLRTRLMSLENLDALIGELDQRIRCSNLMFDEKMDELQRLRAELLARGDLSETELARRLAELDGEINGLKNSHKQDVNQLEGQRQVLQKESKLKLGNLDDLLAMMKKNFDDQLAELERQKLNASPSEIELINAKIAALRSQYEHDLDKFEKFKALGTDGSIIAYMDEFGNLVYKRRESSNEINLKNHQLSGSMHTQASVDSDSSDLSDSEESRMTQEDTIYLKNAVGIALSLGLAEIVAKQPSDPVHYLAHWLLRYRYNEDAAESRRRELEELLTERERIMEEIRMRKLELDAYNAVIDMIKFAEDEADRRAFQVARLLMQEHGEGSEGDSEDLRQLEAEARDKFGSV